MECPFACKDNMTLVTAYKRVCMMMVAMSPAMLNATEPVKALPLDAEQLTEILASPEQAKEVSTINFHQAQQSPFPHIAYFSDMHARQVVPAIANGSRVKLVLTSFDKYNNNVNFVHYIDSNYKDNNVNHIPPWIYELVYHNLGPGKEFLGAKIHHELYDKDGYYVEKVLREVRLDDESAQFLLDFRTGDTKWNNKTNIRFSVTDSPDLMKLRAEH